MGFFSDQRLNVSLLHWQADSLPLSHERSPDFVLSQKNIWSHTKRSKYFLLCLIQSGSFWIHSLSTSNFSQEELPSSSITTTMLISSLSHPCSRFWTQKEKGLYFMSVESGEEVDKEVDSYNQHKHPYWPLLVFLHLMHHLSPYTYYFFPVHPLARKTVSWDTVLTPGIADNRNPTQPGI